MEDITSVYSYMIAEKSIYISKKCYYHYRVRTSSLKRCLPDKVLEIVNKNTQLLYNEIIKSNECNVLEKQYWTLMLYIHILVTPYLFDDSKILKAFGGIEDNEHVILYGAGAAGISIWRYLTKKEIKIKDWVDKEYKYLGKTLPVHNPLTADYDKADKVIITVLKFNAVESIKNELVSLGVPRDKIMWVKDEYIDNGQKILCEVTEIE